MKRLFKLAKYGPITKRNRSLLSYGNLKDEARLLSFAYG